MNDHKERAAFTISKALKAELEDVVPASKRSRFVEQAIADALLRDARKRALDVLDKLPSYDTKARQRRGSAPDQAGTGCRSCNAASRPSR